MFSWFGKINFTPHTKVDKFATYLKDGYLMGSRCKACGFEDFPPRADCPRCYSADFEFNEISGQGKLLTYTKIDAAPTGFEKMAPYIVGVLDLKEGGRLLGWFGETVEENDIEIGMDLQVVPRLFETRPDIKVYYSLEQPGTIWGKAPAAK